MRPEQTLPHDDAKSEQRTEILKRAAFAILFLVVFGVVQTVLAIGALIQIGSMLIVGRPNAFVTDFGRSLAMWLAETSAFLLCARDIKPFPFSPWPKVE